MKNWKIALVLVPVLIIAGLVGNVIVQNRNFKNYLSDRLANMVSPLAANVVVGEQVLSEVIESKTLKKNQASRLTTVFTNIANQVKSIDELGVSIKRLPEGSLEHVVATNRRLSEYFRIINESLDQDEAITLNPQQINTMKAVHEITKEYAQVVQSNVKGVAASGVTGEFWHHYYKKGINQRYWATLLTDMGEHTPKQEQLDFLK